MEFKVGHRVKFKKDLFSGALRRGQTGIIVTVLDLPAHPHQHVDIQLENGDLLRGISVTQIEHV